MNNTPYTPQETLSQVLYLIQDTLETLTAAEAITTHHIKTLKTLKKRSMMERTLRGLKTRITRHNKDLTSVIASITHLYNTL